MESNKLASLLLNLAHVLFAIFLVIIVTEAIPIRLLDPDWILALSANLVNTVTIPLVGLGLIHLAANLSSEPRFRLAQKRLSRLAAWVTLGFFLFLPLLGLLIFLNGQRIENVNALQKIQIELKADQIRKAVAEAQSPQQLQSAMVAVQGPQLDTAALNQPLPQIKAQVLGVVAKTQSNFLTQLKGPYSKEYTPVFKQILRISLLSLISGFGFASLAWNPQTNHSLLTSWLKSFQALSPNRGGIKRSWPRWLTAMRKRLEASMARRRLRQQARRHNHTMNRQTSRQRRQFKRKQDELMKMRERLESARQSAFKGIAQKPDEVRAGNNAGPSATPPPAHR